MFFALECDSIFFCYFLLSLFIEENSWKSDKYIGSNNGKQAKNNTKNEAKWLRATTLLLQSWKSDKINGAIKKSPILPSKYYKILQIYAL